MAEVKDVKAKMKELAKRAKAIKADPTVRHELSERELAAISENTKLMQRCQFEAMERVK